MEKEIIKKVIQYLRDNSLISYEFEINEEVIFNNIKNNNNDISKDSHIKEELEISNRRYLGSKTKLINFIKNIVKENCKDYKSFFDVFGGTGIVANSFNETNIEIIINDLLSSNYVSYQTWLGTDSYDIEKIKNIIINFNNIKNLDENYVSINFGDSYFEKNNSKKIGYIREEIESLYNNKIINFREKCILLTSLIYALDKVANTCGHYDAYRKKMDSTKNLKLQLPKIDNNKNNNNKIFHEDSNKLAKKIKADIVYIDPPYNSRQYGDAYHLLENIIEWKKPDVFGVAKKMKNREHIKSSYCTIKAATAFENLIRDLDCKYILVSYNNMGEKGAGRSQAKISDTEIMEILESKGNVKIYEQDYQYFTTGKSSVDDHKERIFFCEVKPKVENIQEEIFSKKEQLIKSPLNYTGGKYKLFNQLEQFFPKNIETFYDIFSGGVNVGINSVANKIICIDKEKMIIELFNLFKKSNYTIISKKIEKIILEYNLSNTFEYGYELYNTDSSRGVGIYNKDKYLKLRKDFNFQENKYSEESLLMFFTLIIFGFNNQIRFNKKGEMNIPVGKRDFNNALRIKLKNFIEKIKKINIEFLDNDFRNINILNQNDFLYLDPPYLIANAAYNENGQWTENDELDLYKFLEKINKNKIKFALSNVIFHKGKEHTLLKKWILQNNFKVNYLNFNYNNSNYQKKDNSLTQEVLITNY